MKRKILAALLVAGLVASTFGFAGCDTLATPGGNTGGTTQGGTQGGSQTPSGGAQSGTQGGNTQGGGTQGGSTTTVQGTAGLEY